MTKLTCSHKTIRELDINDCYRKVKGNMQKCNLWNGVRKDYQSMDSTLTMLLIDSFEADA